MKSAGCGWRMNFWKKPLPSADATIAQRCALIDADKATYAIAWMCRMLGVPLLQPVAATSPVRIERIFTDSRSAYGCRRIAADLNREGHPASIGLVADLMRKLVVGHDRPRHTHDLALRTAPSSTLLGVSLPLIRLLV